MPAASARPKVFTLELLVKDEARALRFEEAEDLWDHTNIRDLREAHDFEEVVLSNTSLGRDACQYIGKLLGRQTKLRVANFSDMFTGRDVSEIPSALASLLRPIYNLPQLNTVDLSHNALGIKTYEPLVDFLEAHAPLQHLYLINNGISAECGILVAEALCRLYDTKEEARKNGVEVPDLETIVCARNRLESGSMEAWAKVFTKHTKVKVVKLFASQVKAAGLAYLFREGLSRATGLEVLNLYDNNLGHTGGVALAESIGEWPDLKKLNLNDCLLSETSAELLATTLKSGQNKKLRALRLKGDSITPTSLATLSDAVENSLPNLKRLVLDGNDFDEDDPSILRLQDMFESLKEKNGWKDTTGNEDKDDSGPVDIYVDAEDDSDEEADEESSGDNGASAKPKRRNAWGLDELEELAGAPEEEEEQDAEEKKEEIEGDVKRETKDFTQRVSDAMDGAIDKKFQAADIAQKELAMATDKAARKEAEAKAAAEAVVQWDEDKGIKKGRKEDKWARAAPKEVEEKQGQKEDKGVQELGEQLKKMGI